MRDVKYNVKFKKKSDKHVLQKQGKWNAENTT